MSENLQMNTEKEGYICPHCRILFALPKSLGGNGTHCPGCAKLLTIPSAEDGVLPQGISKISYQQAGLSTLEIGRKEATKDGQWNTQRRGEISRLENEDKALRWMLPIGVTAMLILGGLAYVLVSGDNATDRTNIVNNNFDTEEVEEEIIFNHQSPADEKKLKSYLDKMYAAENVDELLEHCRPVEGLREKMVNFYKGEKFKSKEIKNITRSGSYGRKPGFITYGAETSSYDIEQGLIEYKGGIFKLDWESYTAYSEMSWKDMKRIKPTEPVVLRLVVKEANYYNNDFTDEAKWQSVSLANPHETEEDLHGYVKKNSAVEQEVTNFGMSKDGYAVTVKAYYPQGATSDDQIIIGEVINDSWIGK